MTITKEEFDVVFTGVNKLSISNPFSRSASTEQVLVNFDYFSSSARELVWEFRIPEKSYTDYAVKIFHAEERYRASLFANTNMVADFTLFAATDKERAKFFTRDNVDYMVRELCGYVRFSS